MIDWFRRLLGFCPHRWEQNSVIVSHKGFREVLYCSNCYRMKYRRWRGGSLLV